ncbi:hypothetical protein [uncultured Sunxiuqinia sp.]|uniref:hypothetical protein n=1 Tax=uncultured Sunxiuqinia sp. TaxID=1573825 RepID=UPI002AA7BCE1|nr:hypothetical protein [uncultured Sunxiuqinia sp.]
MELKEVKQILQKYFEGESTKLDEQLLAKYFNSDNIDPELKEYTAFFAGIEELSENPRNEKLEDEIMNHILENENQEKIHDRWLWQTVSGIAAAVLIALLVVNLNNDNRQWNDTYKNPDQAYAEAKRTLQYVAGYYKKGMDELQPIKKIDNGSKPLYKSLSTLNKGFEEIQEIEKINQKLKKTIK